MTFCCILCFCLCFTVWRTCTQVDGDRGQESVSLCPCVQAQRGSEETISCMWKRGLCSRAPTQRIYPWAHLQGGAATLRLQTQPPTLATWKFCGLRAGEGLPNPEVVWEGPKWTPPAVMWVCVGHVGHVSWTDWGESWNGKARTSEASVVQPLYARQAGEWASRLTARV